MREERLKAEMARAEKLDAYFVTLRHKLANDVSMLLSGFGPGEQQPIHLRASGQYSPDANTLPDTLYSTQPLEEMGAWSYEAD
jgi:hypothetical protein